MAKVYHTATLYSGDPEVQELEDDSISDDDHFPEEEAGNPADSKRIYILGTGNVGSFVAHSLSGTPRPPPITLLFTNPHSAENWRKSGQRIKLTAHGNTVERTGFSSELPQNVEDMMASPNIDLIPEEEEPIHNLIVAVKAPATVFALSAFRHRLGPASTILFLQNGMGILREVNETVFPEQETRPTYAVGLVTHGLYKDIPFNVHHAGAGTISLAVYPRGMEEGRPEEDITDPETPESSRYLLRSLTRCPVLAAFGVNSTEMIQMQLEKLAVNCIINALTVMFDCRNGDLLFNPAIGRCMKLLIAEVSLVIRSLPELQHLHNVEVRFSPKTLEKRVVAIAESTKNNLSSMLQDVRRGNVTEIEYLNGYVVRRGEELGIKCILNYLLAQMVQGRSTLAKINRHNQLPLLRSVPL